MSNYTPDTEEVRNMYSSPSWVTAAQESERYGEFDDWLKEIRAEAWDEGYRDGHNDGLSDGHPLGNDREPEENPYRKQEEV